MQFERQKVVNKNGNKNNNDSNQENGVEQIQKPTKKQNNRLDGSHLKPDQNDKKVTKNNTLNGMFDFQNNGNSDEDEENTIKQVDNNNNSNGNNGNQIKNNSTNEKKKQQPMIDYFLKSENKRQKKITISSEQTIQNEKSNGSIENGQKKNYKGKLINLNNSDDDDDKEKEKEKEEEEEKKNGDNNGIDQLINKYKLNKDSNGQSKQIDLLEETFQVYQSTREKTRVIWVINSTTLLRKLEKQCFIKSQKITNQIEEDWFIFLIKEENQGKKEYKLRIMPDFDKERNEYEKFQQANENYEEEKVEKNNKMVEELEEPVFQRYANMALKISYYDSFNKIQEKKKVQTQVRIKSNKEMNYEFLLPPDININGQFIIQAQIGYVSQPLINKNARLEYGYIGIKNEGNTCYMNSFLQTLYHIRPFKNLVYQLTEAKKNYVKPLQKLIYDLDVSSKSASTINLIESFGWDKKEATIQQDIAEFKCLFFDALDKTFSPTGLKDEYHNLFTGQIKNYIKCQNVAYESSRKEDFNDIKLNIRGSKDILESFQNFIEAEPLVGENQYQTDDYGKQDAMKGIEFVKLPDVLFLHLKRFEYDFQRDENIKIMDKWEYYDEIDLADFIQDGEQDHEYVLLGVLIHTGQIAGAGHYYAYMRPEGPQKKWYKLNDQYIEEAYKFQVFDSNFGGNVDSKIYEKDKNKFVDEKQNFSSTAYMLVYLKKSKLNYFLRNDYQIPEWIINEQNNLKQEREEKERKQNYVTINITCLDLLKKIQNSNGFFFFKYTINYSIQEQQMDQLVMRKEVQRNKKLHEFFNELAEEVGVDRELLTFWNITQTKNKIEVVRNLNIVFQDPQFNKNVADVLVPQVQNCESVLLIQPLQPDLKLKINKEDCCFEKDINLYTLNPTYTEMFQDIIEKKRVLILVKTFNPYFQGDIQLKQLDYFFALKSQKIEEFITEEVINRYQSIGDYNSLKIYVEEKYRVREIFDFKKRLEEEINTTNMILILSFGPQKKDLIEEPKHSIEDIFVHYNQNYTVTFINEQTSEEMDINIDMSADYYHIIDTLVKNKFFEQGVKERNVFLSAKIKNGKTAKKTEIQYPKYKRTEQKPQKYIDIEQLVKIESKIYVGYDEHIPSKDREDQKAYRIRYQQFFSNTVSEEQYVVAPKKLTIMDLETKVIQEEHFKDVIDLDEEEFQQKQAEGFFQNQDYKLHQLFFQFDLKENRIHQLCLQTNAVSRHHKVSQQQSFILQLMTLPSPPLEEIQTNQGYWTIICHNYTNKESAGFDESFVYFLQKDSKFSDIEKQTIKYLEGITLQYNEQRVRIKTTQSSTQLTSENLLDGDNNNNTTQIKLTNIKLALYKDYKLTEDKQIIDSKQDTYKFKLETIYEEEIKNRTLFLAIEHTNLYKTDNVMKLGNNNDQ